MRFQGEEKKGSILSCSWLVNFAIFLRVVAGLLFGSLKVGIGGGNVGGLLFLHVSGSLWMMALSVGSLFRRAAHLLMIRSAWNLMGGMEASTSSAAVGVVLKAAQMRTSAFL